jgi:NADH-quinone oxidoreductase subunit L
MVFLGQPRTEAAAHARESVPTMTIPLVILAVFAVAGGWIGIPETFPGVGSILGNPFHHFIGSLAEALHIEAEALPFSPFPLLISIVVALGGLFLGWTTYGLRPLTRTEDPDPLEPFLGRLYPVLRHKYYFDELYAATIVRGARWLATFLFDLDQRWVIDPFVNAVGRLGRDLARWLRELVDEPIVDAAVNRLGQLIGMFGAFLRALQTGRAQNYLVVMLIALLVLLALYAAPGWGF